MTSTEPLAFLIPQTKPAGSVFAAGRMIGEPVAATRYPRSPAAMV
jgi:hypothetical protein